MKAYETTATVSRDGELRVQGVPFAAGTSVNVVITAEPVSPSVSTNADSPAIVTARDKMRVLFSTIHGFRDAAMLRREDLYDRDGLR